MCVKNYQIWLIPFKDKTKNVHWPHFFGPRCKPITSTHGRELRT